MKTIRKITAWFMLVAMLLPFAGNAGTVLAEDVEVTPSVVLDVTDDMAENGKITVQDETWEKIVIGSDLLATKVTLQNVIAKEVVVEKGIALTIDGGSIAKVVIQGNDATTITTLGQAKIDTIFSTESAVLKLSEGNVSNLVITSAGASKQIKLDVKGFNGNISINQLGEDIPTNGNRIHLQLADCQLQKINVDSVKGLCSITSSNTTIDQFEAEGNRGTIALNAVINSNFAHKF